MRLIKILSIMFNITFVFSAATKTLYERQRSFSTFLMPHNIKDLSKYLPNDLYYKDLEKINDFISKADIGPTTIVHFKFYKSDKYTKLIGIYCEKTRTAHIASTTTNLAKSPEKYIRLKEKKFFIISLSPNNKLHQVTYEKETLQEILKIINISLGDGGEEQKSIKVVYEHKEERRSIVAVQIIYKTKKENFYIFTSGDHRILIVNEKGHIIPGKLLRITSHLPVRNGVLGSPFGDRFHPILRKKKFHTGQDIKAPAGSEIFSMAEGTVVFANYHRYYGYVLLIYHSNKIGEGYSTLYAHCSKLAAQVGQKVGKGQLIAYVGSTGRSTGPHLHLEVIDNSTKKRLNPKDTFSLSVTMIPSFFIPIFLEKKKMVAQIFKSK